MKTEVVGAYEIDILLEFQLPTLKKRDPQRTSPEEAKWKTSTDLMLLGVLNVRNIDRLEERIDIDARHEDRKRRHAVDPAFPDPGPKL